MGNSASVNSNMKNPPVKVGVLTPPNSFQKPVLYSHEDATRKFKQLDHDIYESIQNSESIEKRKTPKSIFAALILIGTCACFPLIKKFIK